MKKQPCRWKWHACVVNFEVISIYTHPVLSKFQNIKKNSREEKVIKLKKIEANPIDFLKINIVSSGYSFILIRTEVYAWETARNNKLIINNIGVKREPEYNVTFCDHLFTPHLQLGWKIYIECNIYVDRAKVIMVTPEFCLSPISRPVYASLSCAQFMFFVPFCNRYSLRFLHLEFDE